MLDLAAVGVGWVHVHAVIVRSQLCLLSGDPAGATDAERAARALRNPFALATVLNMQGSVAQAAGDDALALDMLREAADLATEVGTTWTLVYTLPGLAVVAARRGQPELAAELFAAGSATAEAASLSRSFPPDLASAQRWLQAVQGDLGPATFERAWARGRRVVITEVPALVRRITDPA